MIPDAELAKHCEEVEAFDAPPGFSVKRCDECRAYAIARNPGSDAEKATLVRSMHHKAWCSVARDLLLDEIEERRRQ